MGEPAGALEAAAGHPADASAPIVADGAAVGYLCWQTPTPAELAAVGLADLPGG